MVENKKQWKDKNHTMESMLALTTQEKIAAAISEQK
jgi:hypothetical protein